MAKHKIALNPLSQSSIQNAIKALQSYQDSLTYKCQLLAEKLAEKGVEIARVQISDLDAIFTGELIQSIHAEYKTSIEGGAVWAVVASSEHAIFVEMGTLGGLGGKKEYPFEFPKGVNWNYGSGSHIIELQGKYGWFYPKDGKWYWCEGMDSRPFMYNTSMELLSKIKDIAKEIFK